MSIIRICDGCGKKLNTIDSAHFWGSKKLRDITFCQSCFEPVEDFIASKYKIESLAEKSYE